jgi:hypothetical protein
MVGLIIFESVTCAKETTEEKIKKSSIVILIILW